MTGVNSSTQDAQLERLLSGVDGCATRVTLAVSPATTTTVPIYNVSSDTEVFLTPRTANAAAALATTYVTCTKGLVTITHAASAQTDRTFGMFYRTPWRG